MSQSSTPLISSWHPDVTYDFTLRVGEQDYSTDLVRVEIRSTVNTPYQHIFLDIFMDPRDVLSEQLFGQQEMKLIIRLKGKLPEGAEPQVEFNLMYIDTEADYAPAQRSYISDQWERSITRFKTVCIEPYKTMSTMVNAVYLNETPANIIRDLISNTSATIDYDPIDQSKLVIDQLIVPPTTLYNVINYIDRTYGVFNGAMGLHTTFDNKIKIQNLSKKTRLAQEISLYLVATDNPDSNKVFESEDPIVFYSRKAVTNSYKGNAVFSVQAPSIVYITKPRNQLSATIDIDLESFAKQYGVIEPNNPNIYHNRNAINYEKRIGYEKDQTGYDIDQTFIHANLSQNILDMASTIAEVEGNLPVLNLMAVGEHAKIISHVDDHLKLGGAYILKGSDIQFVKATTWESFARIYLTRTNIAQQ